jgi:glycosyltransferase involved in cell wall biosynthesis
MNILVVAYAELTSFPPIITLVKHLDDIGYEVYLIVRNEKGYQFEPGRKVHILDIMLHKRSSNSLINRKRRTALLIKYFNEYKDSCKYIWTCTDYTVAILGDLLLSCDNHIMQLMELVKAIPKYSVPIIQKLDVLGLSYFELERYARHAKFVVTPELNRAYIFKAWWGLAKTPIVLPNKPYDIPNGIPQKRTLDTISKIKNGKKTILYQGLIGAERRLDAYADAVRILGNEYQLCVMGQNTQHVDQRIDVDRDYPEVLNLGYLVPPEHLYVTKSSYIGILSYIPQKGNELNVLYCAPNKIYEYAGCGIPMICHALPALIQVFEKYQIGVCVDEMTPEMIAEGIRKIQDNYEIMRENCYRFYNSTDLRSILLNAIEE